MENRKIKEFFLKAIGFLIRVGAMLFAIFLVLNALREALPRKKIQEGMKEIKEKVGEPLREIKEKVSPEVNLPENGLKVYAQIETQATTTVSISLSGIFYGNDLYWKIESLSQMKSQPNIFRFFQNFLYGWKKYQIKSEELEDFKRLKEILEKKGIFTKFERMNGGYNFEVDKEKLKSGILEWKKDLPKENVEDFFKNFEKISGKLLVDEKNLVRTIELEGNSTKVIIKFENLEEEIKRKEKEELDFEKFLISIFEGLLFI
jgi:hypothetical protein